VFMLCVCTIPLRYRIPTVAMPSPRAGANSDGTYGTKVAEIPQPHQAALSAKALINDVQQLHAQHHTHIQNHSSSTMMAYKRDLPRCHLQCNSVRTLLPPAAMSRPIAGDAAAAAMAAAFVVCALSCSTALRSDNFAATAGQIELHEPVRVTDQCDLLHTLGCVHLSRSPTAACWCARAQSTPVQLLHVYTSLKPAA
jgi:hypothetical protein